MSEDPTFVAPRRSLLKEPRPIGWFAAGFLLLICLALALGFYLPLRKAHDRLIEEHRTLAQKAKGLNGTLVRTRTELEAAQAERNALRGEREAVDRAKTDAAFRFEQAGASAAQHLDKLIQADAAKVTTSEAEVAISLNQGSVFVGETVRIPPGLKKPVCAAMENAVRNADWLVRVRIPMILSGSAAGDATTRTKALERAGALGAWLTDACHVPAERVWAGVVVAPAAPGDTDPAELDASSGSAEAKKGAKVPKGKQPAVAPPQPPVVLAIQGLAPSENQGTGQSP